MRNVALAGMVLLSATASQAAEPDLGPIGKSLIGTVVSGASTLAIAPAGAGDYTTLWAIWGDDDATPRTIHLALLHRTGAKAYATWTMQRDGYSPVITAIDDWRAGSWSVLLAQYQSGAAFSHAEFYAIDTKSAPVLVGKLDGSLIQTRLLDGATIVEVYQGADLKEPPVCYGWGGAQHMLRKIACAMKGR